MNQFERQSIILALAKELGKAGSWCGETHLQKSTYFLQELLKVPTGFEFVLYKHGPYSFELSNELVEMRAYRFLRQVQQPPYGPSLVAAEKASYLECHFPMEEHRAKVRFIAQQLGGLNVKELEKVATALYVDLKAPVADAAAEICRLKPHIQPAEAQAAVERLARVKQAAAEAGLAA